MLGTLGACSIEIMPLDIWGMSYKNHDLGGWMLTKFDSTINCIFKTLYWALNKIKY